MKRPLLLIILFFSILLPAISEASDASIDKLFVGKSPSLNISFIVRDAFVEEINEGVKSGIPTTFTFFVELYRTRKLWFDKDVEKWTFKHTVKYDNLKEEYEITLSELNKKIRTKDYGEMVHLMVSGDAIILMPEPMVIPDANYVVRIMAQLDTIKLPFLLRHMLFFVKFWDFETDWYTFRVKL